MCTAVALCFIANTRGGRAYRIKYTRQVQVQVPVPSTCRNDLIFAKIKRFPANFERTGVPE